MAKYLMIYEDNTGFSAEWEGWNLQDAQAWAKDWMTSNPRVDDYGIAHSPNGEARLAGIGFTVGELFK